MGPIPICLVALENRKFKCRHGHAGRKDRLRQTISSDKGGRPEKKVTMPTAGSLNSDLQNRETTVSGVSATPYGLLRDGSPREPTRAVTVNDGRVEAAVSSEQ